MNIAIFASGAGSNAQVIINTISSFFENEHSRPTIKLILSNNPSAGVLQIATHHKITSTVIHLQSKSAIEIDELYNDVLTAHKIDFIILAGYLKRIPLSVIQKYPQRIVNIHPALLPAYGGVGMYGIKVHEAVVAAKEKRTGITIHFVDEVYDHGKIIFQASCLIEEDDTAEMVAKKVLALEHTYYTKIIAETILKIKAK